MYITHTFNTYPEHQVYPLHETYTTNSWAQKCTDHVNHWFGWQCFLSSWISNCKVPFLMFWVIQTHVQRRRQQANLEQGQDRCHVLAFGQCCLSNANKVLDIFHTSPGHLFPQLLITVISSCFPFLSHHIEWHFYTTCLYFPWSSPDTTVV